MASGQTRRALGALRRRLFEFVGDRRYSKPGLNNLDDKLVPYLGFPRGFFIEVGANDGYSQSNTYYLERCLGWSGVLVEGIPELYDRCRRLRRRSRVYQCALVAPGFPNASVPMHYAHLMSVVDGSLKTSGAQDEQIRRGLEVQSLAATYTVAVPARTLASILDELPPPVHIDFLSLDVEGGELDVLKGLNLDTYRPTYILVEARFFDEVDAYLRPHYVLVEQLSHHDYLYKRIVG
jgi:FkbM family methyltransferase